MKARSIALGAIVVSTAALAATYGPFYVSALGGSFATTTFADDANAEFSVANRMAQVYLSPLLNTPSKIATAIKSDFIRIVYFGGSDIADFKIARWPSTIPVDYSNKVPSASTPRMSASWERDMPLSCKPGPANSVNVTYHTGYWGTKSAVQTGPDEITITGGWIDTGNVTVNQGISKYYRFCP